MDAKDEDEVMVSSPVPLQCCRDGKSAPDFATGIWHREGGLTLLLGARRMRLESAVAHLRRERRLRTSRLASN